MRISMTEMHGSATANINLKVSEDERWAFKEWCARNRMSQVDAFRRAFTLLQQDIESQGEGSPAHSRKDNG